MKNLQLNTIPKLQNEDFTIMENGEAYISQRKLAEKCGISRQAVNNAISKKATFVAGWILNEINQIHVDSLPLVAGYYAQQGHKEAAQFLMEIAKAGARAWVYHEAGYEFQVVKKEKLKPMTSAEMMLMQAQWNVEMERKQAVIENQMIQLDQKVEVLTAKASAVIDQSDYFAVMGYCRLKNIPISNSKASGLSRSIGKFCDVNLIPKQEIADPRFGKVWTYPSQIIEDFLIKKGLM